MKTLLIVTFDLIRDEDPPVSLSAGYLLSNLRSDPSYGREFLAQHFSHNLLSTQQAKPAYVLDAIGKNVDIGGLDYIAIGCYVWCDHLVRDLVSGLRGRGFAGALVAGGYQIRPGDELLDPYPGVDVYISGYAEAPLTSLMTENIPTKRCGLLVEPELWALPSPYLDGTIPLKDHSLRVRIETKRGCPFACSFCGHRDLTLGKVWLHPLEKVKEELRCVAASHPSKINVIDPVFNYGRNYLPILKFCHDDLNLSVPISLQVSTELLRADEGDLFLRYCSALDVTLEIGVESIHTNERAILNKNADIVYLSTVLGKLRERSIRFEANLIYGLPGQTYESFRQSIAWVRDAGCETINCHPLVLLRGTRLYENAQLLGVRTKALGPSSLPVVVQTNSFCEDDWHRMDALAKSSSPAKHR